jgi:hypothetical protein
VVVTLSRASVQQIWDAMNTNTIPAGKSTYQGYWPAHLEGLTFDPDICRAELKADAESIGIELSDKDLEEMVAVEATLW